MMMNRERKISLVVLSMFLILTSIDVTHAAVKKGDICKKVRQTATAGSKKYTCVKIGKKLVWNKGVALPTPTPTASQIPVPVKEKAPSNFSDLIENFRGVYIGAWNSSDQKILTSPIIDVKQNILLGPNTKLPNPEIPEMYSRGTQFFAGYVQPKKFNALYFVYDDIKWAEDQILTLYSFAATQVASNCQSVVRCNGANANVPQLDTGNANYGVVNGASDSYHDKGGIEIHEYAHMVQFMQFQGKPTQGQNGGLGLLPNWFVEGHAHLAGNAASARSLSDYKEFRSVWLNARADGLPGYSSESIESFYEKLAPGKFDQSVRSNVYSIGYFTVEALASLKGIDSPMEIVKLVSDGASWEAAFLKVYGTPWKEAAPILAKTVSRMFLER